MKISEFFMSGFGIFSGVHRDGLSGGLNVFVGDNEAGKSTLLAFFRAVFFGFETGTSRENQYKPVANVEHGGVIKLRFERDDKEYAIRRGPGRAQGVAQVTIPDGTIAGEEMIGRLLPGVTKDLHRNVFAFSLDELQGLESLKGQDVRSRIYSYGAGTGQVSAVDVEKQLDAEMAALFSPRAGKPKINALFTQIDAAQAEIRELSTVSGDYDTLRIELSALNAKIEAVHETMAALQREISRLERLTERTDEAARAVELKHGELDAERQRLLAESEPATGGTQHGPFAGIRLPTLVLGACSIALSVALRENLFASAAFGLLGLIVAAAGFRIQAGIEASEKRRQAELQDQAVRLRDEVIARIRREVDELESVLSATDMPSVRSDLAGMREERERLRAESADLLDRRGRTGQRIAELENSDELSASLFREKALRAQLDKHASDWAAKAICKAILQKTRQKYEREKQPRVIQAASRFLGEITSGAYARVFSPLGQEEVQLETPGGMRKDVAKLSRGTREQLYLSLRFGLILEYGQNAEPLPVIMDDILVNFDPDRSRAAARAILELAKTNQVFFFTCHPWIADMFGELDASVSRFEVGEGKITAA
ncbi:MAG: ATP-binding protein [Armatimonadota bacterium]